MTSTLYNNIKRLVTKYFEDKDTEDVTLPQWFEDNIFHLNGKIYVEEDPFDRVPLEFTFEGTELTQYSDGSFDGEDMIIDYGDGTIERTGGRFGHTYSENGTYQVKIYGVTSLEYRCFYHCTGLTSVTIPNSVTNLGTSCFSGCSSLTSIRLNWTGTDILTYKSDWILDSNSTLKFSIPLSTTTQYIDKSYPSSKLVERD